MRRSGRARFAPKAKSPGATLKEEYDSATESAMSSSESESESESGSDTDSDSSSEDTSSSSEEEGDAHAICGVCQREQNRNMKNLPEVFIRCYTCQRRVHPSCIEMPHRMVARVRNYNWQCVDCKCCIKCRGKKDQNKMLFCEQCDRGFHIYCLGIKAVTDSRWSCERCSVCMRCGATKPEGLPQQQTQISPNGEKVKQIKHKKVKWINEYRIDHITKLREHCSMLCVPCGRAKGAKRVQIASPCVSGTTATAASNLPSPPATAQQKQPAKTLSQNQTTTNAAAEAANASVGAASKAAASAASAMNKTSAAGTLPPPPPPVVA
ncbi:supporter of activation of yellow protein-like [Rhagoletis pomonella]|uniref:supporter of activation of yellow protein-like n=1 Tax=Rhagoletis pomonella TaxID=28610 RepID=UPI00177AA148|nr:supporter of activation of yellow protein-like [Rhagoletis pomonella]